MDGDDTGMATAFIGYSGRARSLQRLLFCGPAVCWFFVMRVVLSTVSSKRSAVAGPWSFLGRCAVLTAALLLALAVWDASGWDLPLARWAGSTQGFAWRSAPVLVLWLHEVPRALSMVLLVLLGVGVVWPWGFLHRLARRDRVQLVVSILGSIALATLVKRFSDTSCPWDLAEFGGVAHYVSHWAWGVRDGGPGHCFPAGHASAAFGFVAGWLVLRRAVPTLATGWLVVALAMGLLLGLAQQVRGAHYMSHTLWSAWICWTFGLVVECAVTALQGYRWACSSKLNAAKLNEV